MVAVIAVAMVFTHGLRETGFKHESESAEAPTVEAVMKIMPY